jgi:hypothetical protein
VGVLALGVHSPFPHGYFVVPFLLRYLRDRRLGLLGYVGAVYVAGLLWWHGYLIANAAGTAEAALAAVSPSATAGVAVHLFKLPSPELQLAAVMHLALAVTWNSPIVVALAILAMLRWRTLDNFSRDAALGIVLVLLARIFLHQYPQGVGWGYRFMHDELGTLCLLAAAGFDSLTELLGGRLARRIVVASSVAVLVLMIPWRFANVDRVVGPYRRASEYLAAIPADVVGFRPDYIPWGRQLLRNDPFLRVRPILLDISNLRAAQLDSIRAAVPSFHIVEIEEMRAHGFPLRRFTVGRVQLAF